MTRAELFNIRKNYILEHHPYIRVHHSEFDYSILKNIMYLNRAGRGSKRSVNDCIIMADTETSKKAVNKWLYLPDGTVKVIPIENHVCAWTISINAFGINICTLWGHKPSTLAKTIAKIHDVMSGDDTIIYWHNMSYDWTFCRKFLFSQFGHPHKQLNVKSHYPILIEWENGIIFKDSLILAQRSLDKWAKDMNVEHKKAVGKWNYDKLRSQQEKYTEDELTYIENDTLAGVECLYALMQSLNKKIYSMPFTATGIPRAEVQKRGSEHMYHDRYIAMLPTYQQYLKLEKVYHGGYTHGNRHYINRTIRDIVKCYDFASSYPFCMLAYKFPMEKFSPIDEHLTPDELLSMADEYAFIFKLVMMRPRLKSDDIPMPALQFSKCVKTLNPIIDNGRILCADYIEIYLNEIDLEVINAQYDSELAVCVEIESAYKDYLPRWFTDYVFQCFKDKCMLKGGDPVLYSIAKAKLNSLYGMCVQKCIKELINENYATGEYKTELPDPEAEYIKYTSNRNRVLPYMWGVWVTSLAYRNLFSLGECIKDDGVWLYSDTDSCYAIGWDDAKVSAYNEHCKELLRANGYGPVIRDGREYWLGVAEHSEAEDTYSEFRVCGAKRYCGRNVADNELHITVAGVPKSGARCLNNDINNFRPDIIFDGNTTGKKTHSYIYIDEIYTDAEGNETGDSIDLNACDYKLDAVETVDWLALFEDEITIQVYEENGGIQ